MDRIEEIHKRLPNCHLVMHGSSSVPQELQDIINQYGGQMPQTWGVPVEEIQKRHQARRAEGERRHRQSPGDHRRHSQGASPRAPEKFDPRDYLKPAREAMKAVCVARMTAFGQAGNAGKINCKSVGDFVAYYN